PSGKRMVNCGNRTHLRWTARAFDSRTWWGPPGGLGRRSMDGGRRRPYSSCAGPTAARSWASPNGARVATGRWTRCGTCGNPTSAPRPGAFQSWRRVGKLNRRVIDGPLRVSPGRGFGHADRVPDHEGRLRRGDPPAQRAGLLAPRVAGRGGGAGRAAG